MEDFPISQAEFLMYRNTHTLILHFKYSTRLISAIWIMDEDMVYIDSTMRSSLINAS